jgi:hypothetical protein
MVPFSGDHPCSDPYGIRPPISNTIGACARALEACGIAPTMV